MARRARQEQPGALVAAQAQLGLQLQGGDPVGVAGYDMDRREPGLQRQMAAVHDRACGHGRLPPAGRALPGERLGLQQPSLRDATARADKALRPPATRQIVGAGRIIRRSRLELGAGERRSCFQRLGMRDIKRTHLATQAQITTFCAAGANGRSLTGKRKLMAKPESLVREICAEVGVA